MPDEPMAPKAAAKQDIYNTDFALWLEEQAQALKQRCSAALDWDSLAEEVEGLARSDRRAIKSFLRNVLLHMLELAYWDSERARDHRQWRQHLINARAEMMAVLEDSPASNNISRTFSNEHMKPRAMKLRL